MLDRATTDLHGIGALFKLHLHVVEHVLVLPARHAALLARYAPVFERAGLAVRASITVERHAFFNPGETPDQCLTRRAAVLVLLPVIDEVCLVESAVSLGVGCLGRRHQHQHGNAGLLACMHFKIHVDRGQYYE
jgi:hypothetical protein